VHTVAHVERVLKVVVRIGPVQLPRRKNKLHHVFYVDFRHVDHLQDHVEAVLRHLRERIQINVPAESEIDRKKLVASRCFRRDTH
jgi:hypothetical protein